MPGRYFSFNSCRPIDPAHFIRGQAPRNLHSTLGEETSAIENQRGLMQALTSDAQVRGGRKRANGPRIKIRFDLQDRNGQRERSSIHDHQNRVGGYAPRSAAFKGLGRHGYTDRLALEDNGDAILVFRAVPLRWYLRSMDCAECEVLRRVAEDLCHKYEGARDSMFRLPETANSDQLNRAKSRVNEARLDFEVARIELQRHQRTHSGRT